MPEVKKSQWKGKQLVLVIISAVVMFFSVGGAALAAVSVNRNAVAVAQWLEVVEDSMSRARTFYRVVESLGKKNESDEAKSPVSFFYENQKSLRDITHAIPTFFTKEQFFLFMADWPKLAPSNWQWIEPTKDGIMVFEAGSNGALEKNERIKVADPLWMVDIELPLPESQVMSSSFFDSAVRRLVSVTPSVRFEDGKLYFSVYPSASMTRELLEMTFRLKSIAMRKAMNGMNN